MDIDEYNPGRRIPKMGSYSYSAAVFSGETLRMIEKKIKDHRNTPRGVFSAIREFFKKLDPILQEKNQDKRFVLAFRCKEYEISRYIMVQLNKKLTEEILIKQL